MAEACATLGYKCTLFIARSPYAPVWLPCIKDTAANLIWCDPLPVVTLHQQVTEHYPELYNLPLGFDSPEFISDMTDVLRTSIGSLPSEIWLPVLSGVLARAACLAFPTTPIHAVCMAKNYGPIGNAIPHMAPEKFHKPAISLPPYPACPFSDAKLWQFAEKQALAGAFILNVGV